MATDKTALVVLVAEAEPFVTEFRQKYDPSAAEGMPAHITVLYPFLPSDQIHSRIVDVLQTAVGCHRRFSFSLSRTRTFPGVLYLAPEPAQPFMDLTQSMAERFPECPPYGGTHQVLTPHLTIAVTEDQQALNGISQEIQQSHAAGVCIRSEVRSVTLMVRRSGRWRAEARFALAE